MNTPLLRCAPCLLPLVFAGALSWNARVLAADSRDRHASPPPAEEVERLVEQLGHPKFAERERAARELIATGLPAFAPLRSAANHPDPEIRFRAAKVLAEVRQRDFHRRVQVFAAGQEGTEEYELPGWAEFRRLAGDSRDARELFVKMQSEESRLMQAYEEGPKAVGDMLNYRCLQMLQPFAAGQHDSALTLGNSTAILFVAGRDEAPLSDIAANGVYRVCVDESIRENLNRGPYQKILRELLSAWIRRESSPNTDYQKLTLAMQYDLEAGLEPAVEVLDQGGTPPHLRQTAMVAVAKFGDASHIPLLERHLTDESKYGSRQLSNRKSVDTEMRDVALAALVVLTKQSFADYHMEHITAAPTFVFIPYSCGFETPEARVKALEKWRAYRAKTKASSPAKAS